MNRCLQSYQRAQRIVKPYSHMSLISFTFHVPICYYLVENYGFVGAAWALPINQWVLLLAVLIYSKCLGLNEKCWPGWSTACLSGWWPLLKLALGGTVAVMGEWWSWEICSGMAGSLGTIPLAGHMAIQTFSFFYFPLPFSVSMAATVRIGNLLGEGNGPQAIRVARLALVMCQSIMLVCACVVYAVRDKFAYLYTSDPDVVAIVADVAMIYVCFIFLSGTTQCLRGIMSGCGRQSTLAKVSVFASYGVGLPVSATLGLYYGWGLAGIWAGLALSNVVYVHKQSASD